MTREQIEQEAKIEVLFALLKKYIELMPAGIKMSGFINTGKEKAMPEVAVKTINSKSNEQL